MNASPVTKRKSTSGSRAVDAYLAGQPAKMRAELQRLRSVVRRAAPRAEEVISYRMPGFRYLGMLVWYAGFKDHGSFFVGSRAVHRRFARELRPFAAGRGTLHFTLDRPLPASLVRRMVRARVAENEARLDARRRPPEGRRARRRARGRGRGNARSRPGRGS